jgi:mono/diheme cytochrome c family protein
MARLAPPARKLFAIAGIRCQCRLRNHGCGQAATDELQVKVGDLHGSRSSFPTPYPFELVLGDALCVGSTPPGRTCVIDGHIQRGGIPMTRIVALAAFFVSVTPGLVRAQDVSERLKGASFAQQICAECHAVQAGQPRSPNGQAPTFETVAKTPGMTAIALTAILRTSHRNMPNIILADDDLRNVIAYILTLK